MPRLFRLLIIPALLLVALAACAVIGYFVLTGNSNHHLNPLEALALRVSLVTREQALNATMNPDGSPICFTVRQGDNANTIGASLAQQGFIREPDLFRNYVRYYGLDAQLQAGIFSLRKNLSIPEIALALTNTGANTVTFQVIEGKRIEEIVRQIDSYTPPLAFKGDDFYTLVSPGAAARSTVVRDFMLKYNIPPEKSLEGFLFPDTYTLPACGGAEQLLQKMLDNFDSRFTLQMRADAQAANLTPYQVITLASIVEREAVVADERPLIAGVYLNRLHKPMNLDADPTIQYALGNQRDPSTWWPQITVDDYQNVKSAYNTYLNRGLPPGPIANPGVSSIDAVIHPKTSGYFYFRASCDQDGRHKFATTFEEQVANACK